MYAWAAQCMHALELPFAPKQSRSAAVDAMGSSTAAPLCASTSLSGAAIHDSVDDCAAHSRMLLCAKRLPEPGQFAAAQRHKQGREQTTLPRSACLIGDATKLRAQSAASTQWHMCGSYAQSSVCKVGTSQTRYAMSSATRVTVRTKLRTQA